MLQKSKSKKVWQLKYLVILPLVVGMLFYTSCEQESDIKTLITVKDAENLSLEEEKEVFEKLSRLSESEGYWELTVTDSASSIVFSKTDDGSFISGPNGEQIAAKMLIQSSISGAYIDLNKSIIPFAIVEQAPIFPGCENSADKRACFKEKMHEHISKHFNYPEEAQDQGIQGRVNTVFLIAADGSIKDITAKGPDKLLEDEVVRIIQQLPKMIPGEANGQPVGVPYSIPITFKLQ